MFDVRRLTMVVEEGLVHVSCDLRKIATYLNPLYYMCARAFFVQLLIDALLPDWWALSVQCTRCTVGAAAAAADNI